MKASLFNSVHYHGATPEGVWPVPVDYYSDEAAAESLATAIEQFRMADELGFDWITVAEHHFGPYSLTPNPTILAGALSQVIRRARIALLGPTTPILNPVRVAEEFAMLDLMTGGRIVAGMLRGTPNEYVTYNVNPSESRGRFEEALQLIRRVWTEPQPFGWQGRYYQFRSISIWPRPLQKPHPPIYMSGSSPESGSFAARNRIGLGFAATHLERATRAAEHYRRDAERAGWTPEPDNIIYRLGFHVAETDDRAMEDLKAPTAIRRGTNISRANEAVEEAVANAGYYGADLEEQRNRSRNREQRTDEQIRGRIGRGQLLTGSPDTVLEQIRNIREMLGAGVLDLTIAIQHGDATRRSIELFGTKVLPRMQAL